MSVSCLQVTPFAYGPHICRLRAIYGQSLCLRSLISSPIPLPSPWFSSSTRGTLCMFYLYLPCKNCPSQPVFQRVRLGSGSLRPRLSDRPWRNCSVSVTPRLGPRRPPDPTTPLHSPSPIGVPSDRGRGGGWKIGCRPDPGREWYEVHSLFSVPVVLASVHL